MRHSFPSILFVLSTIACSTDSGSDSPEKVVVEIPDENNVPSQPVLAIGPTQPTANDGLTATIVQDSIDPEGEEVSLTWKWTKDGSVVDGITGPEVDASETSAGEEWAVYAIPSDGTQEGLAGTASVRITTPSGSEDPEDEVNVAPSASIITIAPTHPKTTEDLTVTTVQESIDPNGDTVEIQYKWVRDGVIVEGEESDGVSSAITASGEEWTVYAIPSDGSLIGSAGTATVSIQNTAPEATATLSATTATTQDDVRVSATGTDADGDDVSFSYSWRVNNQPVVDLDETLPAERTQKGDEWTVEVTPNDGTAEGSSVSLSITIDNSAPSLTGASISESAPTESSELHCIAQGWSDADGDSEMTSTEWYVNGSSASTSDVLTGTDFSKGDDVYCVLTPSDDTDTGASVTSDTVTVQNAAPAIDSITLSSTSPTRSDVISASATSADVDGDTITYTHSWWVNGAQVGTGTTLDVSDYLPGDSIAVMMTPNDGTTDGASMTSATVVVQNDAPTITSLNILPTTPATNDDLSVDFVTADADGDTVNSSVQWSVNGIVVFNTGASLSSSLFSKNDTVTVQLTPSDVYDVGIPSIASVSIANTAPMISGVDLSPASPTIEDTLTCTPNGWSDIDGDSANYSYEWTINGSSTSGTMTLEASTLSVGDVVSCSATPNDGQDDGGAMSSSDVTVENSTPVLNAVTLSTAAPYRADTLTLTIDSNDANGDTLTESVAWYVNGSMVSSASSLELSSYNVGDSVYATVTVDDGSASASLSSDTVTVMNHTPTIDSASLSDLNPYTDTVLTVSVTSSDDDGDTLTTSYHWKVNGNSVSTDNSLDGATYFDNGDEIVLDITVDDGVGGIASQSLSATVQNSAPSVDSAFVTPDPAMASDSLECGGVGWMDADNDPESYDVEWFVNGTSVATSATITTPLISFGDDVYCTLTPNDGLNSGTSVDSAVVTISNSKPTIASLTLSESEPMAGAVLTATLGAIEDVDGDTVTTTYSWSVNGTEVSTDVSFDTTSLAGGDDIVLTVTPNDGTEDGEPVSATAQIYNAKPVIDSLTLEPTTAYTNDILTATATASDSDSSGITIQYEWLVNGVLVAETGATLSGTTYFSKGDSVEVRVTPNDGNNDGTADSATVDILNSAPTTPVVLVTPSSPEGGADDLVCTLSTESMDADGDTVDYTFSWTVDGVAYTTSEATNYPGDTISGAETNEGETWECSVTTEDDEEAGGSDSDDVYVGGCIPGLEELASYQMDSSHYCNSGYSFFQSWDWNADGNTDIVALDRSLSFPHVIQNTGGGLALGWTASESTGAASGRFDMMVMDYNQDGSEDVIFSNWSTVFKPFQWQSGLFLYDEPTLGFNPYHHDWNGYTPTSSWAALNNRYDYMVSSAVIDWNQDGIDEIVLGMYYTLGIYSYDGDEINELFYYNDEVTNYNQYYGTSVADMNQDGVDDIVTSFYDNGVTNEKTIRIFDVSTGAFSLENVLSPALPNNAMDIQLGDVEADGDTDILAMGSGYAWLYLNDGAGDYTLSWISPESTTYYQGALDDIDGDGDLDIILPSDIQQVSIYLYQAGDFVPISHNYLGKGQAVDVFDFDNDGQNDVVFTKYENSSATTTKKNTCTTYVASLSCQE